MRKMIMSVTTGFLLFSAASSAYALDGVWLSRVKQLAEGEIADMAKSEVVVEAVKEANLTAAKSIDEIIKLDKVWRATQGVDEWIGGFMNNPCAVYLSGVKTAARKGTLDLYAEIFVMDKQGNIVSETDKTSDYWQGDEEKFIRSFAGGQGAVFIDEASFDESTQSYLVQVSVPVRDTSTGEAIGAITVGINLEAVEK